ncbi:hypothetical protein N0V90_003997 [Kalmusia sp. IMI 367209]|nr:hypothetical protein N0V90_003997 [Kalmusia sp. IMI 367209]
MLALSFAVLAAARVIQAQDDINMVGTVAFIRSGERTPWVRSGTEMLTALGAQQMYELGQNFRGRYIDENSGATQMGARNIAGMSQDQLQPDQLFIQTLDKPYLVASAQAFMQGLYPPSSLNATRNGPWADAVGLLANHTAVDYPLDGYQYANIMTVGSLDPQSIYISGHDDCPNAQLESALYEISEHYLSTQTAEKAFYEDLSLSWFNGDIPAGMLDYMNAYGIYDDLSYYYTHDANTFADLTNGNNSGVFEKVRYLADQDAWYRYGNVSSDTDTISAYRAMAGKTLTALLLGRFQDIVQNDGNTTNGYSPALTLLFGDYEPILSFLSIAEIDYQAQTQRWHAIPPFASALILELFTRGDASPADEDNLWVRFSFHNGTDDYDGQAPQAYSIFRNGPSHMDMPWRDFSASMERVMVNQPSDWCDQCSSGALFCLGVEDPTVNVGLLAPAKKHEKVSPVVAGVIGAVVTLVVAGLLFAAAMFVGGIRFHRVQRRESSLGGFKGSAKLASDVDVSLSKNGVAPAGIVSLGGDDAKGNKRVAHERVGSWELRAKEGRSGDLGDESRRGSFEAIEAAMARPVEPVERI